MAASRSRGKKRTKRRSSRVPALALIVLMVGVGGLLVVLAQDSQVDETATTTDGTDPIAVGSTPTSDSDQPSIDQPIATIGSVAPPVPVDAGDDGDGDEGLVLDDFTPTDTPQPPASPRTVPSSVVANGMVSGALPDGYYLGYLDGVDGSSSIRVRFDTASGPTLDAPLDDLLFVSLRVDARDPSHPGSAVVSARTLNRLLDQGDPTFTIPDTDDLVLLDSTFLVTVVDGRAVGLEAVS